VAEATAGDPPIPGIDGRVVLLAGPGDSTDIVANFLASRVPDLVVVLEEPPSRLRMARRRAGRAGWPSAIGQVLFVALIQPVLRRRGARRRDAILAAASVDQTHRSPEYRVPSVNGEQTVALLTALRPVMVVVNGTRIIATRVLDSAGCPIVNLHAGITPRYRGVHGGYWALAERHPEWVGTTVHLVDPGIDTGGILAQSVFEVTSEDSFTTYPYLHLVHGLPLLGAQVDKVMAGGDLEPQPAGMAPGSDLYYHPTLWGYLRCRWRLGVR
jgi:folate-dependent phosphoribosylglycinamide formyltransferase PurN